MYTENKNDNCEQKSISIENNADRKNERLFGNGTEKRYIAYKFIHTLILFALRRTSFC